MARLRRVVPLLAVALAAAPPAVAGAVESEGTGIDVRHVRNVPYPDLHAPDEVNAGTDLEFLTVTIPGGPAAVVTAPPATTPARPATGTRRPAARRRPSTRTRATVPARCRKLRKGTRRRSRCIAVERRRAAARRKAARRRAAKRRAAFQRRDARPAVAGLQRTFALAGSYGDGLHVIDVTDPEQATRVATWDCGISQGDVQVFRRDDLGGRWFVTFTHDDGYEFHVGSRCAQDLIARGVDLDGDPATPLAAPDPERVAGTFIADVTDPYAPMTVSYVRFAQGSHNQTVHPSGRYLYNSNADLITSLLPAIEIADITDIANPVLAGEVALKTIPGLGTESHDLAFSADGTRAYVAALSHGEVLDTSDPLRPQPLGTIVDPAINVWHETEPITLEDPILGRRDFLIAEDEFLGAIGTGQCPNGGVHVFDVTGDLVRAPVKVGFWNIADVGPTATTLGGCTAHVFQLHREQQLMTIAYYNGGVRVVDLTGLVGVALGRDGIGMKEVGSFRFPDSDTWAVKAPFASRDGFHLYGNDHARGFDVYRWSPTAAGARRARTASGWMTPEQALRRAAAVVEEGAAGVASICLLPPPSRRT